MHYLILKLQKSRNSKDLRIEVGRFINENMKGKGKIIISDGHTYEGDLLNGLP